MVGLLDIHPRSELVKINGEEAVAVTGLSAKGIATLLSRFPQLLKIMSGKAYEVTLVELAQMLPEAVAAAVAAACGNAGNAEAEAIAEKLDIETQLDILQAMGRVTFPRGVGPFAQRLTAMFEGLGAQASVVNSMNSQKPSSPLTETSTPPSGT